MNDLGDYPHVYEPRNSDRLLLLLHGTGGDEYDLVPFGQAVDPGASILSPRGTVDENGKLRFFRWKALGVFDEEDVRVRSQEMIEFLQFAAANYGFSIPHVTVIGYSHGANMAASLLLLHPGIIRTAVLLRPMVPIVPTESPNLKGTRVLVVGGLRDKVINPHRTMEVEELLREYGADVSMKWLESGHDLLKEDVETTQLWLSSV